MIFAVALMFCAGSPRHVSRAEQDVKPLTKDDVLYLLKNSVPPARISELGRTQGITFPLTPDTESELKKAGASEDLLKASREVAPKPPQSPAAPPVSPILMIESSPGSAQVYVDDEPMGTTSPEGRFKLSRLAPGKHRLRLSLLGHRDFEQDFELRTGETTTVTASLQSSGSVSQQPTSTQTGSTTPGLNAGAGRPGTDAPLRFPVAHAHTASWCLGYLYITPTSIRYEVVRPEKDKKHAFETPRTELRAVGQWILLGTPENATEIKTARADYHFWLLPNDQDPQSPSISQWNPRSSAPAEVLISALQGAPVKATTNVSPASPRSPAYPQARPSEEPLGNAPSSTARPHPAFNRVNDGQPGNYVGVGMKIDQRDNKIVVISPFVGAPAYEAGIRAGDVILAVDGISTDHMTTAEVGGLVRGPRGSQVHISILRIGVQKQLEFTVTRDEISHAPTGASVGQDAWKPDAQVGDLQFNVPDGWRQMQTRDGTVLVPSGLSQNSVVVIGFPPAETLGGDPRSWFQAAWANWKTQMNLIDSGEPESSRNPNGFDVLRSYSRATSPRLGGNSVFTLAAAVAGNRVAPYFYLCNTDCERYDDAFHAFELSLTLATLERSRTNAKGGGTAGGLEGLYVTFKATEGDVALGTFKIRGHTEYLVFFPDGNVIRFLPKEGLENFDFRAALRRTREYCGRYRVDGDRITITWGDTSTVGVVRDGAKLQMGDSMFEYEPVSHSGRLLLNGTYHPEYGGPGSYISFTPDGHFSENGALSAVDFAGALPGSGSYRIEHNTLTLSYNDGRTIQTSFFVLGDEAGSHKPGTIYLNTNALLRSN